MRDVLPYASFYNVSRKSIFMHGVISFSEATSYDKCKLQAFEILK